MKKQFIFLLILILFFPIFTHAYPGQYSWDPLHVQIEETPSQIFEKQQSQEQLRLLEQQRQFERQMQNAQLQRSENQAKSDSLIAKYGAAIYSTCYQSYCANKDMSNPNTQAMCVASLEYNCLIRESSRSKINEQSLKSNQILKCPSNSTNINGNCVCNNGYNKDGSGSCAKIDIMQNHQICKQKYGINYIYDIASNICRCPVELEYVVDLNNQCLTRDQYCKNNFGYNSYSSKIDIFNWRCITNSKEQPTTNVSTRADTLAGTPNLKNDNQLKKVKYATFAKVYNIRQGASTSSKIITTTKKGIKYEVIDLSNKNWIKIRIDSKRNGWVLKTFAKIN